MRKFLLSAALFAVAGYVLPGYAMNQMPMDKMDMHSSAKVEVAKTIEGAGEIVSMDKAAGKVVLKHEAIPALHWPPMTMGFKVKDKAVLNKLQPGAKVKFTLVPEGKNYVITSIR